MDSSSEGDPRVITPTNSITFSKDCRKQFIMRFLNKLVNLFTIPPIT